MNKIIKEELFDGQVIRFTLNAPKANVLDAEMMEQLQSGLGEISTNVKLIQLTGTGEHFSFGASVTEHTKENAPKMLRQFHSLFKTMINLSIPTMAMVSGQCLGGGLELAIFCNFLFLDETARMGQPEIMLGVFAPPASLILPMKVGQAKADDLLLTGRSMKPKEVMSSGLGTQLFEDNQSMIKGADSWVEKHILPKSASSLRFSNSAARTIFHETLKEKLDKLAEFYTNELMETRDANEGINSFLEKRKPRWKNK
ncbi:MAG: enoyl-CoA hydratase-related protein [Fidelibacterota bacterium]